GKMWHPRCAQCGCRILGADHALRHISPAAWLSARVPRRPPLHSQIDEEGDKRNRPNGVCSPAKVEIGQERCWIGSMCSALLRRLADDLQLKLEGLYTSDLAVRDPCQNDNHRHLQDE